MPRQARKKSESGIYHIMLRGIDRQQIFEDMEDHIRFLDILKKCKENGIHTAVDTAGHIPFESVFK